MRNLPKYRRQHVGWRERVYRGCERGEDGGDAKLCRREVFEEVRVKGEDAEPMSAHGTAHHLHREEFVLESITLVEARENIEELFGERLGILQEL